MEDYIEEFYSAVIDAIIKLEEQTGAEFISILDHNEFNNKSKTYCIDIKIEDLEKKYGEEN